MTLQVQSPFQQFFDTNGDPLDNGSIYIGVAGLYPPNYPIPIFWDPAGTIPAAQPVKTSNGYAVRNGTPARIYVNDVDYSITVKNKNGATIFTALSVTSISFNTLAGSNGSSLVGFIQAGAGAVVRTVQDELRDYVTVKQFGAKGDYTTDDSLAIDAAMAAVTEGGTVFFPRGVYRVTKSFVLPRGVKIKGAGRPTMQIAPIFEDDKRYLRPGFKHLIPGSSIVFSGSSTLTKTTSRSDRFSSFGYAIGTTLDYPNEISDIGLIMDMDVFNAAGVLTTPSTDNRSSYDSCLLIDDSPLCNVVNVCMFGYWAKSCLTIVTQDSMANPDYNFFHNCEMVGDIGVALIGSQAVNPFAEGLSGSTFVQCKINDRTHHDRTQTNVLELGTNVIYVDGITSVSTMISGHKFIGCSLRGTVEVPINLDHSHSFSLVGCITEFTNNGLYSPQLSKFIVGTANTQGVSVSGTRALSNGANIQRLAGQIAGPLVVDEDDDGSSFLVKGGKGVCIGPFDELSGDPTIQLTTDFTSGTRGWNFRYGVASGNLSINFNNASVALFDQTGNIVPTGRIKKIVGGATRESRTIASGVITITGGSSYIAVATEGAAPTDDLDTINGGQEGDIIIVTAFSGSNDVVLKDGTGLRLSADCILDSAEDTIMLMKHTLGFWVEIARSNNSA